MIQSAGAYFSFIQVAAWLLSGAATNLVYTRKEHTDNSFQLQGAPDAEHPANQSGEPINECDTPAEQSQKSDSGESTTPLRDSVQNDQGATNSRSMQGHGANNRKKTN